MDCAATNRCNEHLELRISRLFYGVLLSYKDLKSFDTKKYKGSIRWHKDHKWRQEEGMVVIILMSSGNFP